MYDNLFDNLVVMHHNTGCLGNSQQLYLILEKERHWPHICWYFWRLYSVQSKFLFVESTRLKLSQVNSSHVIYDVTS